MTIRTAGPVDIRCDRCEGRHFLDSAVAGGAARRLIAELESARSGSRSLVRLDDSGPLSNSRPLFDAGGGKMFGCLIAESEDGTQHELRAFSGMLGGQWGFDGFAAPLFDVARWRELEARYDPDIAAVTARIAEEPARATDLQRKRAQLSRELMARYHGLYRMTGAAHVEARVEAVVGAGNMASGMGDCCAPKLLNEAHRRGWRALSLAEFFVGVSRRPAHRVHGSFYPPCSEKCGPLLGFLLCPQSSSSVRI